MTTADTMRDGFAGGGRYALVVGFALLGATYATLQWHAGAASLQALYAVNVVFFAGAAAGAFAVGALASRVGRGRPETVVTIADVAAISSLLLAAMFALVDVVLRAHRLRLQSAVDLPLPLGFAAVIVGAAFCLVVGLGYVATRRDLLRYLVATPAAPDKLDHLLGFGSALLAASDLRREWRALRAQAWRALPVALLLYATAAATFGAVRARPGWPTALIAPGFLVTALSSGLALATVAAAFSRALGPRIGAETVAALGRALRYAIPVLGLYLFAETVGTLYVSGRDVGHLLEEMLFGSYAPFMVAEVLAGLIVPSVLLALPRARTGHGVGLAALLVLAGVLVARWCLMVPGMIGHAHAPRAPGGYAPAWPDLGATVAIWALGLLVSVFLGRRLAPARFEDLPATPGTTW